MNDIKICFYKVKSYPKQIEELFENSEFYVIIKCDIIDKYEIKDIETSRECNIIDSIIIKSIKNNRNINKILIKELV